MRSTRRKDLRVHRIKSRKREQRGITQSTSNLTQLAHGSSYTPSITPFTFPAFSKHILIPQTHSHLRNSTFESNFSAREPVPPWFDYIVPVEKGRKVDPKKVPSVS